MKFVVPVSQSLDLSALSQGDEALLLIAVDDSSIGTGDLENALKERNRLAEGLVSSLKERGIESKVLVEWAPLEKALENCLARENAAPYPKT